MSPGVSTVNSVKKKKKKNRKATGSFFQQGNIIVANKRVHYYFDSNFHLSSAIYNSITSAVCNRLSWDCCRYYEHREV